MEHFSIAGALILLLALIVFVIVRAGQHIQRHIMKQTLTERKASNVIVTAKNQKGIVAFRFKNTNMVDYAVTECVYNHI